MSTHTTAVQANAAPGVEGTPHLWRIEAAARFTGLSADALETAIEAGQVPVTLRRIGPRNLRYVNAAQLRAWITGTVKQPDEDLFA